MLGRREATNFVKKNAGGEVLLQENLRGTHFYGTTKKMKVLKGKYLNPSGISCKSHKGSPFEMCGVSLLYN